MALLAPGAAGAATCERKPPKPQLSEKEQVLRATIAERRMLGFRHDRAFVKRLIADRAARRRAGEGYPPMTAREQRYMRARDRMTQSRAFERLASYVARHGRDFGEISIRDDFPAGAYVRVPVVRDAARHRPVIAAFGVPFRMPQIRWSRRELQRVQTRIDRDEKALEAQGIFVVTTGFGGGERLSVGVATRRRDVRSVMRRRYGDGIRVHVMGPAPRFLDCRRVENYEVEPDGVTLKVHWGDSGSVTPKHIEVIETPDAVYLGAVVETGFFENANLRGYTLPVTLAQPIGDRRVLNIERERPLKPGPWRGGWDE